jgi:hypothetical protein
MKKVHLFQVIVQCTLAPNGYGQELHMSFTYFDSLSLDIPMVCNELTNHYGAVWFKKCNANGNGNGFGSITDGNKFE